MKRFLLPAVFVLVPFVFIAFINAVSPSPTDEYLPERCTRYCERHGCLHYNRKFKSTEELLDKWWYQLYRGNVKALNAIPLLNYHQANILVYFILYPLLIVLLLYRLLKE